MQIFYTSGALHGVRDVDRAGEQRAHKKSRPGITPLQSLPVPIPT